MRRGPRQPPIEARKRRRYLQRFSPCAKIQGGMPIIDKWTPSTQKMPMPPTDVSTGLVISTLSAHHYRLEVQIMLLQYQGCPDKVGSRRCCKRGGAPAVAHGGQGVALASSPVAPDRYQFQRAAACSIPMLLSPEVNMTFGASSPSSAKDSRNSPAWRSAPSKSALFTKTMSASSSRPCFFCLNCRHGRVPQRPQYGRQRLHATRPAQNQRFQSGRAAIHKRAERQPCPLR